MYDVFVDLLQRFETTPYKVSKATGISQTSLSDWKRGRSTPKQDKLDLIANYFKVDPRIFKSKNPQGLCYDCGFNYVPGYEPDELNHKANHRAWENAVKKFGFCWPYAVRENAKAIARKKLLKENLTIDEKIDANIEIMKALFSRSLEAADYSLDHVDFPTYVSMLLNQKQFKEKIERDVYDALVKQYGVSKGIEEGKTYYIVSTNKSLSSELHNKYSTETVAAHKEDDEDWTPEELRKIEEYKQLLRAARKASKES